MHANWIRTMIRSNNVLVLIALSLITHATYLNAESEPLRCASAFSDNMVLQRNMPVPVWGRGSAGETITISFAGMSKQTVVSDLGEWILSLDPLEASRTNREMTISDGTDTITIHNIVVGEVWLASGQSNMEWQLRRTNFPKEEVAALNRPDIRIVTMGRRVSPVPLHDSDSSWQSIDPETASRVSAVASILPFAYKTSSMSQLVSCRRHGAVRG